MFAYAVGWPACLRALVEIGGNEWLVHAITTEQGGTTSLRADITDDQWASMLSHPSLLDLRTKQLWLGHQLEQAVGAAGAVSTRLLVYRADLYRMLSILLNAVH